MIVIDASMAVALMLPDEPAPTLAVRSRIYAGPLIAPSHWPVEVGNALLGATRRGRITPADRLGAIHRLSELDVAIADHSAALVWAECFGLAEAHGLTLYDAVYLWLSCKSGAALASNDRDLVKAARACDVAVITALP